jgi:hypothetical protein
MEEYKKPPLGTCPYRLSAINRIYDLSCAIGRYGEDHYEKLDNIERWAYEIILQCNLIRKIDDYNKRTLTLGETNNE